MTTTTRPITLLIAALGGEGGGVLTNWIVSAATRAGLPVQSTSIPGVAQRTAATTYYVEIFPTPWADLGGRRPVLSLTPGVGDVDAVLASELLEAGRMISAGFVTPDRTLLIASTHRAYAIGEKLAMGDGRFDSARLMGAIEKNARAAVLVDMAATAKDAGAMTNAVMLGALAASGALPISAEAFAAAIRAEGKAAEPNLRGFEAGLAAAARRAETEDDRSGKRRRSAPVLQPIETEIAVLFPGEAKGIVTEGARRLAAYQDTAYARLYLDRLKPIAAADARTGAGGRLLQETARHLAVRMSFEDVIHVARAKLAPERAKRIAAEMGVKPGQPLKVFEFLKPGVEEMCQILPPWLARRILALAERYPRFARLHFGMRIQSTAVSGYLRLLLLAKLASRRRGTFRYAEEQAAIEEWLRLIEQAAALSPDLALEIVACARLIKGYGDTHTRGTGNYRAIEARVIRPVLAGRLSPGAGIDAIASARAAALVDPEGESLDQCLSEIERRSAVPLAAE